MSGASRSRRVPDCTKSSAYDLSRNGNRCASMCPHPVHGPSDALQSVALNLLDEHLDQCLSRAVADSGKEAGRSGSGHRTTGEVLTLTHR